MGGKGKANRNAKLQRHGEAQPGQGCGHDHGDGGGRGGKEGRRAKKKRKSANAYETAPKVKKAEVMS